MAATSTAVDCRSRWKVGRGGSSPDRRARPSRLMEGSVVQRRTCALWCPDWPVVAARRLDPESADAPVVVVAPRSGPGTRREGWWSPPPPRRGRTAWRSGCACARRRRGARVWSCSTPTTRPTRARFQLGGARGRGVWRRRPRASNGRRRRGSRPAGRRATSAGDDALGPRASSWRRPAPARVSPTCAPASPTAQFAAGLAAVRQLSEDHGSAGRGRCVGDTVVVPPGETPAFLAPWPVTVLAGPVEASYGGGDRCWSISSRGSACVPSATYAAFPSRRCSARFGPPGALAHRFAGGEPGARTACAAKCHRRAARDDRARSAREHASTKPRSRRRRSPTGSSARLDALGLCCARVVVEAETEHGERLTRTLAPRGRARRRPALVARVRWQLEAWLVAHSGVAVTGATALDAADAEMVTGGLTVLRLAPDDVIRQRVVSSGSGAAIPRPADRAGRALARVQAHARARRGRRPQSPVVGAPRVERVRWVPWGDARDDTLERPVRRCRRGPGRCPAPRRAGVRPTGGGGAARRAGRAGRGLGAGASRRRRPSALRLRRARPAAVGPLRGLERGRGPTTCAGGTPRRRRALWQVVVDARGDGRRAPAKSRASSPWTRAAPRSKPLYD